MLAIHEILQHLFGWIIGTTYIRFFHISIPQPLFFPIETAITILAVVAAPARQFRVLKGWFHALAQKRAMACLFVFCLSLGGRLILLTVDPLPEPVIHDEFSFLLASDTLAHGRLANPVLPAWHHFEPFHILMEPHYASMYFPGFPLFLAAGQRILGSPRAGVLICSALAAASLCWMLQSFLPPVWALGGGLLAVLRLSWFSYFGDTYWGGAGAAILAGCLVMGAAARLVRTKKPSPADGLLLACGTLLLLNTRPYEGAALSLPIVAGILWKLAKRRQLSFSLAAPALAVFAIGAACTAYYCYRVTGHVEFPESLQRDQWAIMPALVFQHPDYHHTYQFADQDSYYRGREMADLYSVENTVRGYILHVPAKVFREWIFYIAPGLSIALIGLIPTFRSRRDRLLTIAFCVLTVAVFIETSVQPQYFAVGTGFIYLVILNGLRWLRVAGRRNRWALKLLNGTLAGVLVMTVVRLFIVPTDSSPPSWASLSAGIPAYTAVHEAIDKLPGKQLVLVRYQPVHFYGNSWINNGYDVASQKVIWARDTEPRESNSDLICAFPGRQILLLQPPESGYVAPPDRTAGGTFNVSGFISPYPADKVNCSEGSR